ncbi:MAG TPA: energy transducer TonB [Steroidobacteraceae bacterium]
MARSTPGGLLEVLCVIGAIGALALLGACSSSRAAARAPAAPEPDPFGDAATFIVAGPRFAPGETAIVRVCVSIDGTISSATLIGSSGDQRFDELALNWARQVKLADATQPKRTREVCGPVRVEIRVTPLSPLLHGEGNSLG